MLSLQKFTKNSSVVSDIHVRRSVVASAFFCA